jgi:hypothetical protein
VGEEKAGGDAPWLVARTALLIVLGAVTANLLFNVIATILGAGFPYSTFVFTPDDRYGDFFKLTFSYPSTPIRPSPAHWGMNDLFAAFETQISGAVGTPHNHFHLPPLATLLALLWRLVMHWIDPVLLFLGLLSGGLAALFYTVLNYSPSGRSAPAFGTIAILCYPTLLIVDRGHFFSLVTGTLLIAATLRVLRDGKADFWSILMFAIALNFRPNAGIIPLALFLCRKGFGVRDMLVLCITVLGVFGASLVAAHQLYPPYDLAHFRSGLKDYAGLYIVNDFGQAYGSSLLGMLRALFGYGPLTYSLPIFVAAALFAATIIGSWRGLLNSPELLFLVLAAYALGSQVFADYHLLVFIVPLVLLARERSVGDWSDWAILLACSFVLAPKNYIFHPSTGIIPWSWQIIANPTMLLASSIFILARAWRRKPSPADRTGGRVSGAMTRAT